MANSIKDKVVLITGVSSGLGQHLAHYLLRKGAKVAGTFRNPDQLRDFENEFPENAIGILMDITDKRMVQEGVAKVVEHFGKIDVLANNAGVGALGAIEEYDEDEIRRIFDINYFGGLSVIRSVLPIMRQQNSGHLVLFSALGGFHGVPGFGIYASAKGATIILGETLEAEVKSFGINVTVLTIGVFDTGMATRVMYTEKQLGEYKNTPVGKFKEFIKNVPGNEPNDPYKAAIAITKLLESDSPPLNAALGKDALQGMREKLSHLSKEIEVWEDNAISTAKN